MKKRNTRCKETVSDQNPVAKFAHHFNKAQVFRDKTQYRRNAKHRKQEVPPSALSFSALSITA